MSAPQLASAGRLQVGEDGLVLHLAGRREGELVAVAGEQARRHGAPLGVLVEPRREDLAVPLDGAPELGPAVVVDGHRDGEPVHGRDVGVEHLVLAPDDLRDGVEGLVARLLAERAPDELAVLDGPRDDGALAPVHGAEGVDVVRVRVRAEDVEDVVLVLVLEHDPAPLHAGDGDVVRPPEEEAVRPLAGLRVPQGLEALGQHVELGLLTDVALELLVSRDEDRVPALEDAADGDVGVLAVELDRHRPIGLRRVAGDDLGAQLRVLVRVDGETGDRRVRTTGEELRGAVDGVGGADDVLDHVSTLSCSALKRGAAHNLRPFGRCATRRIPCLPGEVYWKQKYASTPCTNGRKILVFSCHYVKIE